MSLALLIPRLSVARELWMKVGEIQTLPASRSAKIRIGAKNIVRAVEGDKVIRLIALKPGTTSMVIDEQSFSIRVSASSQREFVSELRKTLKDMMGLSLDLEGEKPVIEGTLLRFEDWETLAGVARRYHGEYLFRARALPDVGTRALTFFKKMAKARGYPILRFAFDPNFTAALPKAATELKTAAETSMAPFGISIQMSESTLSLQPLVKTQVVLAEVERSFSRRLGIEWPGTYEAQLLPKLSTEAGLMVTLQALEQSGKAQILASPNLVCRSGSEARFHAGGEFPIRVSGRHSQDVVWKSHGVVLKVKPKADFQGAISLEVETEVSMLDTAHSVDGIPALKINTVKSHFDLAGKRTIALSGLLRQELGQSSEGLPWLSSLPILGPLFSSKNFQNHRSELVVFVTPEVTTPEIDEDLKMPEGWITSDP